MKVRVANHSDIAEILRLGEMFHAESSYSYIPYDYDATSAALGKLIDGENSVIFVIGDQELIGMIGLVSYQYYFSNDHKTVQEMFFWVDPELRGAGLGKKFLVAAESWAKYIGASSINMIALESSPKEVSDFYIKNEYVSGEKFFSKRIS